MRCLFSDVLRFERPCKDRDSEAAVRRGGHSATLHQPLAAVLPPTESHDISPATRGCSQGLCQSLVLDARRYLRPQFQHRPHLSCQDRPREVVLAILRNNSTANYWRTIDTLPSILIICKRLNLHPIFTFNIITPAICWYGIHLVPTIRHLTWGFS